MHTYDVVVMTVKNVANISYYFVVYLCRLLFRYRRTCTRCVSVVDPRDNGPVSLFNGHFIAVVSVELIQFKHILFAAEKRGDSIHIAMMMKVVRCGVSQNDTMCRTRIMEQHTQYTKHVPFVYLGWGHVQYTAMSRGTGTARLFNDHGHGCRFVQ